MKTEVQRDTAVKKLREVIMPGATIYVVLRRKNKLGTRRWLEFYHLHNGKLKCITWNVALSIQGDYCREHDSLRVTGAGLDMGYASVRDLGDVLFGPSGALTHKWL